MSKIEDLDALLQSLPALKPPGASKSKIAAITQFSVDNIHLDATIAQKFYTYFKKSPATHKLGYLFVIDSVTRQWVDKAKQAGQEISGHSAVNGTFASGVQRITELMPSLLDDTVRVVPQDQKAKVINLIDIWERTSTFPTKILLAFKQKLANSNSAQIASKTPPGSPPPQLIQALGLRTAISAPPAQALPVTQFNQNDAASLLKALGQMAVPLPGSPVPPPPVSQAPQPVPPALPQDLNALLAGLGQAGNVPPPLATQAQARAQLPVPFPPTATSQSQPPTQLPPQFAAFFPGAAPAPIPPPQSIQAPPPAQNPLATLTSLIPPHILNNPEQLTQVLQLFNDLAKANVPQDQWGPVLAALNPQAAQPPVASSQLQGGWQQSTHVANGRPDDYSGRHRDRSRSPDYSRNKNGRLQSPVYGTYDLATKSIIPDPDQAARHGGSQYRQRSPPPHRNGSTDNQSLNHSNGLKWTSHDSTLPRNHIKVLSRTLFVGGCNTTEHELRSIFARFGQVQTCIVNLDKRHAFVKMCTRAGAVAAKVGMEELAAHDPTMHSKARQTKWGVGFGPRECCDYSVGESVIPISSLTEADNKWALTAEYGGTGGQPIESGLVMEEPDIEIGAGVSSKAMSKRIGPDGGRNRGGRNESGGGGGGGGGGGRGRNNGNRRHDGGNNAGGYGGHQAQQQQQQSAYASARPPQQQQPQQPQEQSAYQPPPPVPNFGFSFAVPGAGSTGPY